MHINAKVTYSQDGLKGHGRKQHLKSRVGVVRELRTVDGVPMILVEWTESRNPSEMGLRQICRADKFQVIGSYADGEATARPVKGVKAIRGGTAPVAAVAPPEAS